MGNYVVCLLMYHNFLLVYLLTTLNCGGPPLTFSIASHNRLTSGAQTPLTSATLFMVLGACIVEAACFTWLSLNDFYVLFVSSMT